MQRYKIKKGQHVSPRTEFKKGMASLMKGIKRGPWSASHRASMAEIKRNKSATRWIEDRSKLSERGNSERRSSRYGIWRREIYLRDNFKCKIANNDCVEKIEAHHILSFRDYPELRYEINNGITLCKFHHPRKRIDESRLSPFFQILILQTV